MLKHKIFILFFVLVLLSSCGDDEGDIIRYSASTIEPFKVYVKSADSEQGGVELGESSITSRIRKIIPESTYEYYVNTTITFLENNIIIDPQASLALPEKSPCRFEGGSLYISKASQWQYFGDGDQRMITIRQHYIAHKQNGSEKFQIKQVPPQKDMNGEVAAGQSPFGELKNMVEGDTLIWCTRNSVFR